MKALRILPLLAALALVAGCSDNPVDSGAFDEGVRTSPNRGTNPRSGFEPTTASLGGSTANPVTLTPSTCDAGSSVGPITLTFSVNGNQVGTATFKVNTTWVFDGTSWTGADPTTVTVPPQGGGDVTFHPVAISIANNSATASGQSTLNVQTFDLTNSNATGAKLSGTGTGTVYVEFVSCGSPPAAPSLTLPDNITDIEATSPDGASVDYADGISAADYQGNDLTDQVMCTPPSGSIFPLGTTEVTCEVTDAGGRRTTGSFTITVVDTTPPAVSVTGVEDGAIYTLGSVPEAGCSTTDSASGVATEASLSLSGGPVGAITASCGGAVDNAGNAQDPDPKSVTYSVIYNWNGFFRPIDNLPTLNSVKAGSAIPVKFSLNGNQGLNVFAVGYPKSAPIACDATAPVDGIEETVTAGSSSLSYDAATDQYNYVWKTEKLWSGCRQLTVKLNDGKEYRANFKFLK